MSLTFSKGIYLTICCHDFKRVFGKLHTVSGKLFIRIDIKRRILFLNLLCMLFGHWPIFDVSHLLCMLYQSLIFILDTTESPCEMYSTYLDCISAAEFVPFTKTALMTQAGKFEALLSEYCSAGPGRFRFKNTILFIIIFGI